MEKIYNFAKKDFFIFASTYVAIIFLVLLCFFPVCRAFERSEQNQAIAEIRDYASSMLGELDLQEQAILTPPEIYTVIAILRPFIITVPAVHLLPYSMT